MDQKQKNEVMEKIRSQVEENIKSDVSESSPSVPAGKEQGDSGSASGGSSPDKGGSEASGKGPDKSSEKSGGIRDKISEKTSGIKKGLNNRVDSAKKRAGDKVNKLKEGAENKIKDTGAYKELSKIRENANRVKQETQRKAQEQIAKIGGERAKQALELKRKANLLRNKINEKTKKFKKALAVKAKKSNVSSGTVKLVFAVTLALALVVDAIDILGTVLIEAGTIPTIIAYLINVCSSIIISLAWFMVFSGSKGKGNKQSKVIIRSILILFGLENIPIIELLPFNAIAVILNYIDYKAGQKEEN